MTWFCRDMLSRAPASTTSASNWLEYNLPIRLVQGSVDLRAVDELAVCDGWPGSGAPEQEVGQVGDVPAAIEAVVPLARIARQVLGADAVEGAVEPRLHIAEQDMDDGQHGIGVFAAVLDDRVVAEAVGEAVVALRPSVIMRAPGLAAPRTKPPRFAAVAAGRTAMRALPATKWLFLMPSPCRGAAGTVSTAIAIRLLFGSVRPRPRLSGLPRPP